MARRKTIRRTRRRSRTSRRRTRYVNIDVSALIGGVKLIDGLVGLDNVADFNFKAMFAKLKESAKDPLGPGGLVEDGINAGMATAALKGVNAMQKMISGRNVGVRLGKVYIHL